MTPADPPVGAVTTRWPRAFSSDPASAYAATTPRPRCLSYLSSIARVYTSPAFVFSLIGPGSVLCGAFSPAFTILTIAV